MSEIAPALARFLALTSVQVLVLAIFAVAAIRLLRMRGRVACALLVAVMAVPLLSPMGALLPDGARVEVPAGPLAEFVDHPVPLTAAEGEPALPLPPAGSPSPPGARRPGRTNGARPPAHPGRGRSERPPTIPVVGGPVTEASAPAMGLRELVLLAWAAVVVLLLASPCPGDPRASPADPPGMSGGRSKGDRAPGHGRTRNDGIGLAAGLGLVTFMDTSGPAWFKGGHNDYTGNMVIGLENEKRCLVLLSNDVRAERIYPELAQMILGDTKMPWLWEYNYKWTHSFC